MEDAYIQIENIYTQYASEIDNAYKNCKIEMHYLCFYEVIKSYPKLDFENYAYTLGPGGTLLSKVLKKTRDSVGSIGCGEREVCLRSMFLQRQ